MLPVPDIAAAAISGRLADLIRAEIGEQHSAKRCRPDSCEFDDLDAFEGGLA